MRTMQTFMDLYVWLKEFAEKGDELVKAGGPVPGLPVVPSVAVNALLDFASVRPGIDMEAPFAFILMGKEFDHRHRPLLTQL